MSRLENEKKVSWSEERLKKEWNLWTPRDREIYRYWFEAYKPYEKKELDAARSAAWRVLEDRRRRATDPWYRRVTGGAS